MPTTFAIARACRSLFWPLTALALLASLAVITVVDLTPRVETDFFFATDDPALQASNEIEARFPTGEQLFLAAAVEDPLAEDTLVRVEALTAALEETPGITAVQSLTRGPFTPQAVPGSPFWGRLLLSADNPHVTLLIVWLEPLDETAARARIAALEELVTTHHTPSFAVEMSGVPYVVEQIRRALVRDLRIFSLAALLIFGTLIALLYRSLRIVLGTLATALAACAVTLALLALFGVPIGVLTANIVTIVFVLTLSHLVFLTANVRAEDAEEDEHADAVTRGVARTLPASFWAMSTTLLGFASLRVASAQPLRELAISGVVGTLVALLLAFGLYPRFLRGMRWPEASRGPFRSELPKPAFAAILVVVTLIAAVGLPRMVTDPSLLDFFAEESPMRAGIARIDDNGGSSPLSLVVRDPDAPDGRLDGKPSANKLAALQETLDQDPAIGVALSLEVVLAEARRVPLTMLMSREQLISLLESPQYQQVARTFLTEDRTRALFFLRMKEGTRTESRRSVIERLRAAVANHDLEAEQVGGIYDLQATLGELVSSSLVNGLSSLLVLFALIAFVVSRHARTAVAMLASLAAVPIVLLGTFGHLRLPVDFISSPAANVAIALGIDGMIHLVSAVRRGRRNGISTAASWQQALAQLRRPILSAMLVLAGGFGIFAASSFPPTQRFGLAVAFGTLTAAAMALLLLPVLAGAGRRDD